MADQAALRLLAEDEDDLKVISAAIQDGVTKVGNLSFDARERRFSIELNRYRWEAQAAGGSGERVRSLLAVDSVLSVKVRGVAQGERDMVISTLSLRFEPGETAPAGTLYVLLAGDGEIALEVEAIDVTLLDSDYVWPTRNRPDHERRRR